MGIDLNQYRMKYDLHTHTTYSHGFIRPHGKGTVQENVEAALRAGLDGIAISDHGPGHIFYGIRRENLPRLRRDIETQRKLHPEIRIYMSVEANILESENHLDISPEEFSRFDFVVAGYHYGVTRGHCLENWFQNKNLLTKRETEKLREKNTEMTVGALRENKIKILSHPGDKGPFDMRELARACAQAGTLMEISTWHAHLTVEEIRICMKEDVRFIISSDAHTPDRVGSFRKGLERAYEAGLDLDRIVNIEKKG